ncbi:MAG: hydrolase [Anaerolineae bacterium]|nr:hydrolase [Anaerolineae bacterium]
MTRPISDFRPAAADLALVVIDIQEKMAAAMPEKTLAQVVRNTNILLASAHEFEMPVLVTEQYRRGLGPTLPALNLAGVNSLVEKMSFSCCGEPAFVEALKTTGRRSALLCGMETHVCVLQTALDLLEDGWQVFVAADAVCSRSKLNWKLSLETMRQAGVVITPTETIVFQLLGVAGDERFKRLSRLVK